MEAENFDLKKFYMFRWPYGILHRVAIIVATPTLTTEDKVLFHFPYGYKGESFYAKKSEILAVKDDKKGEVKLKRWRGRYTILNKKPFDKCLDEGLFELEL